MSPRYSIISAFLLVLVACNQAKSPDQVARDTATAEQQAENRVEKSAAKAEHAEAVNDQRVADEAAKGRHDIALAQCESLSGADQRACRDQADAAYQTQKAQAKEAKENADPQH